MDDRTDATSVPLYEDPEVYARRWTLLGVMCLSLTLVVMSVSGLNVALPSIQRAPSRSSGSARSSTASSRGRSTAGAIPS
jgi:hypothetical protein